MKSKLDKPKRELLQEFIKTFLPQTATKRKNTGNEISYIRTTLDKIFIQHFGFNLTSDDILFAFKDLNYAIFTSKGVWDIENKLVKPSRKGDLIRYEKVYSDTNASFLYIEVEVSQIRLFRKASASLPLNTGTEKINKTVLLLDQIDQFKQKYLNNSQHAE